MMSIDLNKPEKKDTFSCGNHLLVFMLLLHLELRRRNLAMANIKVLNQEGLNDDETLASKFPTCMRFKSKQPRTTRYQWIPHTPKQCEKDNIGSKIVGVGVNQRRLAN